MYRALAGFLIVVAAVAAAATLTPRMTIWGYEVAAGTWLLALTVVVMPAVVAWGTLEVLHLIRPRRMFIGHARATVPLLLWGALTAVVTIVCAALGMAWGDRFLPDPLIFSAAAFVAVVALFPLLPRRKHGHCVYCMYDLRGASVHNNGRCTECGKVQPM